jgi:citrate lyase subunit beta/citryl-CoA lyase
VSDLQSLLFVPGNQERMLEKAGRCTPRVFVPDLEDSVPEAEKEAAREIVKGSLAKLAQGPSRVIPRVNALDSGLLEADLDAVVGPQISGVCVGKVRGPEDVLEIAGQLSRLERARGLSEGSIGLVLWIETAVAVVRCYEICTASPRIQAVAFGAEDFTEDMGIVRTPDDADLIVPRSSVCIAARAAGIASLDGPFFAFKDADGLLRNAAASKRLGFTGKFAIHPDQIAIIERAFAPSEDEIAQARRVIEAFESAEREGRGSTSLDGRVVDIPVVKRAHELLRKAGSPT